MAPYTGIFFGAMLLNIAATFRSSSYWNKYKHLFGYTTNQSAETEDLLEKDSSESPELKARHSALLKKYLAVYLLAVCSDWLQGPYVYALYGGYGYSQHEIAVLFVAGFGSSMLFGTFVGGMADSCGRKKFAIFFTIIYALSCVTKHFKDFGVLMLGRLLGGIATSLLFSVFDSWLIKSHNDAGLSSYLSKSFASAQYGNSIVAITAGLVANKAADMTKLLPIGDSDILYKGGYLAPFDIALVALIVCGILVSSLWNENYGSDRGSAVEADGGKKKAWHADFTDAFFTTIKSKEILFTGIICSLFEGSMYIFVFMWTPAVQNLTDDREHIPFGLLFSTFMVSCMAGSSIFSIFIGGIKNEKFGMYVFGVATFTFVLMALSKSETTAIISFLFFECCVGCYFPMMGTMKSVIVPESKRAAIYNLYRIPLNFIVLFSLLTDLTPRTSFALCTVMMATATFLQYNLVQHQNTFYSTSNDKPTADDLELGTSPTSSRSGASETSKMIENDSMDGNSSDASSKQN